MKACRARDPDLNKCALKNGNEAIRYIVKGDRKYRIPRMIPLEIPSVTVKGGKNLNVKMDNLKIYGLDKAKLIDINIDLPRKIFKIVLSAETITVIGDYDIDAKVLILPIKGRGPSNITLYNPVITYTQEFELEMRRGDYHGYIKNSELHYEIDRVFYYFGNLFDGNEQLGIETNRLLNENWPIVHNDLSRPVGETILEVINSIIENVYDLIPYQSMILFD
ncbi:circadian clock-controlled protein daywake-like [Harmonia axyridis]|uniref:circadian clock-controlled protein daywake-like n=1 Tax=Harmonia axyridis TaxID=115357 RepID=UPI001E278277|nr:circadian clock-controlled protein daywake-like [Harmonia axyridis]XP_045468090.1 circadian clock-controlled protein daywake-like [Harmonia axyridis]XP_045468096.1 circadian clock-controlled protein daywake-like [Harmonia axyridis]